MGRELEVRAHRYRGHAKEIRRIAASAQGVERTNLLSAAREFEDLIDDLEGPTSALCFCGYDRQTEHVVALRKKGKLASVWTRFKALLA